MLKLSPLWFYRLLSWLLLSAMLLAGWLAVQHPWQLDVTRAGNNSLSTASQQVLKRLEDPVQVTVFTRSEGPVYQHIADFIARYQRYQHYSDDFVLTRTNPDLEPDRVREVGIRRETDLLIEYQGRQEVLNRLDEAAMTQLLQRLAMSKEQWLVFLTGHGEQHPLGKANHDLGLLGRELESRGYHVLQHNLGGSPQIPVNTSVFVIAGPITSLLPGEMTLIGEWVTGGGNLLWLSDTRQAAGLDALSQQLGVNWLPGRIIDLATQEMKIETPTHAIVSRYPNHPITRNFSHLTLFPEAVAIALAESEWQASPLLQTQSRSWNETGPVEGQIEINADQGEVAGPLTLGVALERTISDGHQQRVLVIGDGDFISNRYIANGGNLDLGLNMFAWLGENNQQLDIPSPASQNIRLILDDTSGFLISLGNLFAVPAVLLLIGLLVWRRRRYR